MADRGGFKDGSMMGAVNVQVILRCRCVRGILCTAHLLLHLTREHEVPTLLRMLCRPCSKQELASRTPQIVQVVEANKEVVLMQSVAGKHMGRAFHYDKVCRLSRFCLCHCSLRQECWA